MKDVDKKTQQWVWPGRLQDLGDRAPVYPYNKLHNILKPEDVRPALLEDTGLLERECGIENVAPFYNLMWVLNGSAGITTSHAVAGFDARVQQHEAYMWAKTSVEAHITMISRHPEDWPKIEDANVAARELLDLLRQSRPSGAIAGWCVGIFPSVVLSPEGRGFGVGAEFVGFAGNRAMAARRWAAMCEFIAGVLLARQVKDGGLPAPPHIHPEAFDVRFDVTRQ